MELINKDYTYAVIGASNSPDKYGYKVLKDLKEKGFNVVPINPKEKKILGLNVYANVNQVQQSIDVAIFIVPPNITERILEEIEQKGIRKIWMQPGSESEKAIKYCKEHNIECAHDVCIMINTNGE